MSALKIKNIQKIVRYKQFPFKLIINPTQFVGTHKKKIYVYIEQIFVTVQYFL